MQGVLLAAKPRGWTSFDVVNYVRKIVAQAEDKKPKHVRVGHTGTLDPLATGLLVLLIGKEYTKRAGELTKLDKTYEVSMKLGEISTTGDEEGIKTKVDSSRFKTEDIEQALQAFQGDIMQTPPVYSAMKINGQRAYKLARAGKEVVLEARPVHIHNIQLIDYSYPEVKFTADVSSGTYVRSLVEDIGKRLGTGAYMSDLRRTHIGGFDLKDAVEVSSLDAGRISAGVRSL